MGEGKNADRLQHLYLDDNKDHDVSGVVYCEKSLTDAAFSTLLTT